MPGGYSSGAEYAGRAAGREPDPAGLFGLTRLPGRGVAGHRAWCLYVAAARRGRGVARGQERAGCQEQRPGAQTPGTTGGTTGALVHREFLLRSAESDRSGPRGGAQLGGGDCEAAAQDWPAMPGSPGLTAPCAQLRGQVLLPGPGSHLLLPVPGDPAGDVGMSEHDRPPAWVLLAGGGPAA
jgi:hypothetical protein